MFSQKFISIRLKGLAKLNTFIIALCIAKKKTQYIAYEYTDIAYQGTEEKADDGDTSGNPGNFLAIVRKIANYYIFLQEHIFSPLRKNASYMSPTSQNELTEIIGKSIIQKRFMEEIKDAHCHSVLADEVTSSNDEILSVVYVI